MTFTFSTTVVIGIGFLILGIIVVLLSVRWLGTDDVSKRIENFVVEQETTTTRWQSPVVTRREFSGSFFNRTIAPFIRDVIKMFGRFTPAGSLESIGKQLVVAGHPLGLGPREFYGIRTLLMILGIVLAYLVLVRRGFNNIGMLLALSVFLIFYIFPILWLRMQVNKRQKRIQRELPDALDMLSVCATAGLGFDQSLQRVSEYWKTDLAKELGRVINEMEMGLSRAESLRNLADRLDVSELSSFVTLILQADQLGMSIADTLNSQADQMRAERHFRAQEEARKIPIKMLFPMAFFIFPALLAIIMGPSIPDLIGFFQNFGR